MNSQQDARQTDAKYAKQQFAFPDARRQATLVAELNGCAAPPSSLCLKLGAAAMGVSRIASDFHGAFSGVPGRHGRTHWLAGRHDDVVRTVNADVDYKFIDNEGVAADLQDAIRSGPGFTNAWLVVHLNDPAGARASLAAVGSLHGAREIAVILVLVAPAGVYVARYPNTATALDSLPQADLLYALPAGRADLAMIASGICLNEVMLAGTVPGDDPAEVRVVAWYDLSRPSRTDSMPAGSAEAIARLSQPAPPAISFAGGSIIQIGAGGLGCWTAFGLAAETGARLHVFDGDGIEESNLNRQVLLVRGRGGMKADVIAEELRDFDPAGEYTGAVQFVREKADLLRFMDIPANGPPLAVIAVPDNNLARVVGSEAACDAGVAYAQAGTGAVGGQASVHPPGRACYACACGPAAATDGASAAGGNSCSRVAADSVVCSNMVLAGVLLSELREGLSGRQPRNLRFAGDGAVGNKLVRMVTVTEPCPHVASNVVAR